MIKSMTGYGRSEKVTPTAKCSVEIKSVNHRYLDLSIKLPRKLNMFEADIREVLKDGNVELLEYDEKDMTSADAPCWRDIKA